MKVFGPMFFLGLLFLSGPIVAGALKVDLPTVSTLLMTGFGIFMVLISGIALVITKLYVKTKADEAFVRTGMGGRKVIVDGGALVLPVIHELVRVSLGTIRLQVSRKGGDALITRDKLRADVMAEFYVKVQSEAEAILNAARSLGERLLDPRRVSEIVEDKLVSALRTVAAKTTLEELNSERDRFMEEVIKIIKGDLEHNGLVLETATISALDQTDVRNLNPNNVFDAQGMRTIAEITEDQKTKRNEVEREGEKARAVKDVATRKQILTLEQDRAEAEAMQAAAVVQKQAEEGRKAEQANIDKRRAIEIAEVSKQQALEVAAQERQQAGEVAERKRLEAVVQAEQAVEVAQRHKEKAIADAEADRAAAQALQAKAEAEAEKERQAIETVKVTAAAERSQQQQVIGAKADAEKAYVAVQRKADGDAYSAQKQAEGRKAAADADAEAITKKAEAEAHAAKTKAEADQAAAIARAEGHKAEQMIPVVVKKAEVEVGEKQVEVDKRRVDEVLVPELKARAQHGQAAQNFELEKQRIEATARVEIELAKALGGAFGRVQMDLFGTPEDAGRMLQNLTTGMGLARKVNGFAETLGPDGRAVVGAGAKGVLSAVTALAERLGFKLEDMQAAIAAETAGKETPNGGVSDPSEGDDGTDAASSVA